MKYLNNIIQEYKIFWRTLIEWIFLTLTKFSHQLFICSPRDDFPHSKTFHSPKSIYAGVMLKLANCSIFVRVFNIFFFFCYFHKQFSYIGLQKNIFIIISATELWKKFKIYSYTWAFKPNRSEVVEFFFVEWKIKIKIKKIFWKIFSENSIIVYFCGKSM